MDITRIEIRGVNAYLADTEGGGLALIDAGWPWSASSVKKDVEKEGYELGDIDKVLVTHYDLDHVGGLARLARAGLDAPVYIAEPDASFLDGSEKPPLRGKGAFQRLAGVGIRKPSLPTERVEDGDEVLGFEVCETPGHTPGHVVYFDDEVAFVGDSVREKDGTLELMPSFMSYDKERASESIAGFAERFKGEKAYVGHGNPVQGASEKLTSLVQSGK